MKVKIIAKLQLNALIFDITILSVIKDKIIIVEQC